MSAFASTAQTLATHPESSKRTNEVPYTETNARNLWLQTHSGNTLKTIHGNTACVCVMLMLVA